MRSVSLCQFEKHRSACPAVMLNCVQLILGLCEDEAGEVHFQKGSVRLAGEATDQGHPAPLLFVSISVKHILLC